MSSKLLPGNVGALEEPIGSPVAFGERSFTQPLISDGAGERQRL